MSLQFSDTTNFQGLAQKYAQEIGYNTPSDFTSDSTKMALFASEVNQALDDFWAIAIPASGTWQLDDSNQTDYPIIYTNLVSGQRDYSFTTDGSSNLILDIYRVFVLPSATATSYVEIFPIDAQSDLHTETLTDGAEGGGSPYRYDKTANGFFLDPVPNYSIASGIKVYINREASYFTGTDTTKKPGVPGILHKYFYLKPALNYARRNNLTSYNRLEAEVAKMEGVPGRLKGEIAEYFSYRARDEKKTLTMNYINFR